MRHTNPAVSTRHATTSRCNYERPWAAAHLQISIRNLADVNVCRRRADVLDTADDPIQRAVLVLEDRHNVVVLLQKVELLIYRLAHELLSVLDEPLRPEALLPPMRLLVDLSVEVGQHRRDFLPQLQVAHRRLPSCLHCILALLAVRLDEPADHLGSVVGVL